MTRWNIVVSEDTDRTVRSYLARTGGKRGDLSRFVARAVRQAIFWETVDSIWERNKHLSAEEAQALADEAIAQVRADCRAPRGGYAVTREARNGQVGDPFCRPFPRS